jgi:hypothetical protein
VSEDAGFVAIAIHHVAPKHTEEMLAFMRRVVAATEGAPGFSSSFPDERQSA